MHLFGDGHLDAAARGARAEGARGCGRPRRPRACLRARLSSARPRPSSFTDAAVAREAPVQVSTRSPRPARPINVSSRPPSASASRVISASPRVTSAATTVRAQAETRDHPRRQRHDVLGSAAELRPRHVRVRVDAEVCRAQSRSALPAPAPRSSSEAATTAVGWPAATSCANEGPERQTKLDAALRAEDFGDDFRDALRPVSTSTPFVALTRISSGSQTPAQTSQALRASRAKGRRG